MNLKIRCADHRRRLRLLDLPTHCRHPLLLVLGLWLQNCWPPRKTAGSKEILFQQLISLVNPAGSQDKIKVRSSSLHGLHMSWEPGGFTQLINCWKRIPPLTSYSWECDGFFSSSDRVLKSFSEMMYSTPMRRASASGLSKMAHYRMSWL
jgi:hypothetical protein